MMLTRREQLSCPHFSLKRSVNTQFSRHFAARKGSREDKLHSASVYHLTFTSFACEMEYPIQLDNTFTTCKEEDIVFCHQT